MKFLHRGILLEADGNGDIEVTRSRLGGKLGGPKQTSMKNSAQRDANTARWL